MANNGKPGRPRKVASQEPQAEQVKENPILVQEQEVEEVKTATPKAEQKPEEVKAEFIPDGCIKTKYTFNGQAVYQKPDGQYVIATGQYVRLSNTDQNKRR